MSAEPEPVSINEAAFAFVQQLARELNKGDLVLPSFPDSVLRIRKALDDPNCSPEKLVRIATADSALAGRLLKMSNSALLQRGGGAVTELRTAIFKLGFAMVRNAAISVAMQQMFHTKELGNLTSRIKELWEESTKAAAAAYVIAKSLTKLNPDEAFLAGMLHNIGKVYIFTRAKNVPELIADPQLLTHVQDAWHGPIGKSIIEAWGFSAAQAAAAEGYRDFCACRGRPGAGSDGHRAGGPHRRRTPSGGSAPFPHDPGLPSAQARREEREADLRGRECGDPGARGDAARRLISRQDLQARSLLSDTARGYRKPLAVLCCPRDQRGNDRPMEGPMRVVEQKTLSHFSNELLASTSDRARSQRSELAEAVGRDLRQAARSGACSSFILASLASAAAVRAEPTVRIAPPPRVTTISPLIEFGLRNLLPDNGGNGSDGFVLDGTEQLEPYSGFCYYHGDTGSSLGASAAAAGDFDGDGLADLFVGAPGTDVLAMPPLDRDAGESAGEGHLVFGRSDGFSPEFEPRSLGAGACETLVGQTRVWGYAGSAIASVGDVNGDGFDDALIGEPGPDRTPYFDYECDGVTVPSYRGRAYLLFGRSEPPATLELHDLLARSGGDGSVGVTIIGRQLDDLFGGSLSGAGDVNGDGIDDFIVGAARAGTDPDIFGGEAYVVFGHAPPFPPELRVSDLLPANGGDGSSGFVMVGQDDRYDYLYATQVVSTAGDINADGIDDVVVTSAGSGTFVVFGSRAPFPPKLDLARLLRRTGGDGRVGFVIDTRADSVAPAGDVNADGMDDLAIGVLGGHSDNVYVVFGSRQPFGAELDPESLLPENGGNGSRGLVLTSTEETIDFGKSVAGAGDFNGDDVADLLIGAPYREFGATGGNGYLVFGRRGNFPPLIDVADLEIAKRRRRNRRRGARRQ
jgi:HD-like signal output (HDOD) protein